MTKFISSLLWIRLPPSWAGEHWQEGRVCTYLVDPWPSLPEGPGQPCCCPPWRTARRELGHRSPAQGQRSWPCWGPQHPSQEPWRGCLEKRSWDSKYNPLSDWRAMCTQNHPAAPHSGSHCISSCLAVCIHVHLLCADMVPGARFRVLNSAVRFR